MNENYEYLSRAFKKALDKASGTLGRVATQGTDLYDYQVEFSYLMNEIQQGPTCMAQQHANSIHKLIKQIEQLG